MKTMNVVTINTVILSRGAIFAASQAAGRVLTNHHEKAGAAPLSFDYFPHQHGADMADRLVGFALRPGFATKRARFMSTPIW